MTLQAWTIGAGLCALVVVAAPQQGGQDKGRMQGAVAIDLGDWPEVSRKAGEAMIQAYGPPHEATASMLMWKDNGPWAHTIVFKDPIQHDFPMPHQDVLEQFIHYRVPPDKFDELANYDGSVICERTAGWMSARCDKEAANFLALNLAHDIVTGEKDVQAARKAYAEKIQGLMQGKQDPYTSGLQMEATGKPTEAGFSKQPDTGDPDKPAAGMDTKPKKEQ